jgi:hypothetical protein
MVTEDLRFSSYSRNRMVIGQTKVVRAIGSCAFSKRGSQYCIHVQSRRQSAVSNASIVTHGAIGLPLFATCSSTTTGIVFLPCPLTTAMSKYDEPDVIYRGYMIPMEKFNTMMKKIPAYRRLMKSQYGEHSHTYCYCHWKHAILDEKLKKRAPKIRGMFAFRSTVQCVPSH